MPTPVAVNVYDLHEYNDYAYLLGVGLLNGMAREQAIGVGCLRPHLGLPGSRRALRQLIGLLARLGPSSLQTRSAL